MTDLKTMHEGGYSYAPGVVQYSAGVSALPSFEIRRVRFSDTVPLREGFERIAAYLSSQGRPSAAFCACELRSPAPFDEAGFKAFNQIYTGTLIDWGIMQDDDNPVARANVCPELDPPAEPGFHAFCYTVPATGDTKTFAIAGSGETPEGKGNYRDHTVRYGETSADAMEEKARWVLGEMERRMAIFGAGWKDTTAAQLYTVYDIHPFIAHLVERGAMRQGLTWHFNRPPVAGLDYEMDCRRIHHESVLDVDVSGGT